MPIGNGLTFEGIYDRLENKVYLYKQKDGVIALGANGVFGDTLEGIISDANLDILRSEMELLDGAGNPFDLQAIKDGKLSPVFFGSALADFGVTPFLHHFLEWSPGSRLLERLLQARSTPMMISSAVSFSKFKRT